MNSSNLLPWTALASVSCLSIERKRGVASGAEGDLAIGKSPVFVNHASMLTVASAMRDDAMRGARLSDAHRSSGRIDPQRRVSFDLDEEKLCPTFARPLRSSSRG